MAFHLFVVLFQHEHAFVACKADLIGCAGLQTEVIVDGLSQRTTNITCAIRKWNVREVRVDVSDRKHSVSHLALSIFCLNVCFNWVIFLGHLLYSFGAGEVLADTSSFLERLVLFFEHAEITLDVIDGELFFLTQHPKRMVFDLTI